ncbi:sporulation integral membrane protein YlbJ [Clostridium massiliodielmoense]|uniref:sporulation integral membrane protein YlbJ n=1 Tax=Clostridium massiliodielmoense TaxID=1776385 RepID=UPI0004D9581D|nr:sporulation integral membrane protein YlbJ [Clostridium massiliodielmoense]KEH97948.1 membrane protein [Clostridium botulinum C/D str. BKT12695]
MIIFISLLLTFIIISILIFILFKSKNIKLNINLFMTLLCTIFIINIVLSPESSLKSALYGGKLFITSVFPSVFPFLILINIMISFDGINIYSKILGNIICRPLRLPKNCSVVLIVSILCGYPLGAKYAYDLYKKNAIDIHTCHRLINIASNPSPIFILGVVGASMLKNHSFGVLLLVSTYLSCVIMALILPRKKDVYFKELNNPKSVKGNKTLGEILKSSIDNAFKTAFSIGGFIILFSVLTSIIKNNILSDIVLKNLSLIFNIQKSTLEGFFFGVLEMTNGCSLIAPINMNIMYKLAMISFLLAFSGLSIISQTYSIIHNSKLSLSRYMKRKFIQGIICSIITIILYKINIFNISKETFSLKIVSNNKNSFILLLLIEMILLITPIIIYKLKKLFSCTS